MVLRLIVGPSKKAHKDEYWEEVHADGMSSHGGRGVAK